MAKNYFTRNAFVLLAAIFVSGCEEATATKPDAPTVYLSAIYAKMENGMMVSYPLFGPSPGEGHKFNPTPDWYVPLKGATANATPFLHDGRPSMHATKVMYRLVWIPHRTDVRLMASFVPEITRPERLHKELARFSPWDNWVPGMQKTEHCLKYPRPVDVDITDAYNQAIDQGMHMEIYWEVRQHSMDGTVTPEPLGMEYNCGG